MRTLPPPRLVFVLEGVDEFATLLLLPREEVEDVTGGLTIWHMIVTSICRNIYEELIYLCPLLLLLGKYMLVSRAGVGKSIDHIKAFCGSDP